MPVKQKQSRDQPSPRSCIEEYLSPLPTSLMDVDKYKVPAASAASVKPSTVLLYPTIIICLLANGTI